MDVTQLLITLEVIVGVLIVVTVPAMKFVKFFWQLMFFKRKYKQNVGLVFTRSMGKNFGIPRIVNIGEATEKHDNKLYVYSREMFTEGTFFGCPFAFFDAEDMKTSLGLYQRIRIKLGIDKAPVEKEDELKKLEPLMIAKHQSFTDGKSAYHQVAIGTKNEKGEDEYVQTNIPVLEPYKTSVTVQPGLLNTAVVQVAFGEALKEFFKKYQLVLILVGIAALAAGVAAFFAYNNQNAISSLCQVNFNDLKQATMQCVEFAKNTSEVLKK
jgi:hypothetical protein